MAQWSGVSLSVSRAQVIQNLQQDNRRWPKSVVLVLGFCHKLYGFMSN